MADKDGNNINRFDGSLNTDIRDYHLPDNAVTHARNATNDFGSGNFLSEPANKSCITTAFTTTIIGFIYLYDDQWIVFSTNNANHEIGIFKELSCEYTVLVIDGVSRGLAGDHVVIYPCLNFSTRNLITGRAKQNFDCTWSIYWSDEHRNPDRTLNLSHIPLKFVPELPGNKLDCSKITLIRPVELPCISLTKGASGGQIFNGSYYATARYTVNGQPVTDFLGISNILSVFSHDSVNGALDVKIIGLDQNYDEYELVVISTVNQQVSARRIGLYSTNQGHVSLDIISNELIEIPLEFIPIITPQMDSSTSITDMQEHLIRIGPRGKFDFNYQLLANSIVARWVSVEYPADYYRNGGVNPSFYRDEVYSFFIRWVWEDGERTPSYHIPGREPYTNLAGGYSENSSIPWIYPDSLFFEKNNYAFLYDNSIMPFDEQGYIVAIGDMGYVESTERYPSNSVVWGALAGQPIRHHKFPSRSRSSANTRADIYVDLAASSIIGPAIRALGVKFYNIPRPVDNNNAPITGIKSYEILVGSRQGNKSIIAKGIVGNTFAYDANLDSSFPGANIPAAYPNYPYNDLRTDPYITTVLSTSNTTGYPSAVYPQDFNSAVLDRLLTFHSPETMFKRPFLNITELRLDGIVHGTANLDFHQPENHPKHKLPTNLAYFISLLGGIGEAVLKIVGARATQYKTNLLGGDTAAQGASSVLGLVGLVAATAVLNTLVSDNLQDDSSIQSIYNNYGDFVEARDPSISAQATEDADRAGITGGSGGFLSGLASSLMQGGDKVMSISGGVGNAMGKFFKATGSSNLFPQYWGEGMEKIMTFIMNMSKYQQYALQQTSHCFYNGYALVDPQSFLITDSSYLGPTIQDFTNVRINNLYRSTKVILKTSIGIPDPTTWGYQDQSKQTLHTMTGGSYFYEHPDRVKFTDYGKRMASSWYASAKVRLRNQYGQLGDIKQLPVGCPTHVDVVNDPVFTSNVFFGGDVYITRYTEKDTMFFFYDWLYNQPDGAEYNYLLNKMLPFPAYWVDTIVEDRGDMANNQLPGLGGSISGMRAGNSSGNVSPVSFAGTQYLPSSFRSLDRGPVPSLFTVKNAYFYLFNSSVKDFYVESEVNCGYRDWEEPVIKRHYDEKTYKDLFKIFSANPDIIKADNFYKYDFSLSVANSLVNVSRGFGYVQPSYYDPLVAETCYTKHPNRIIWSLPQNEILSNVNRARDNWRIFLANNYRDFKSTVTEIKPIGLTGALIVFKSDTPLMVQGMESLRADGGTLLKFGDGAFLRNQQQLLTNADREYQYGACQDLRSIVNTPFGTYWMSADQGKIFTLGGGLLDIAMKDRNWWFSIHMPYQLLKDFPNYDILANPVSGIGCQAVYDSENELLYFSKKDYKLKILPDGFTIQYSPSLGAFRLYLMNVLVDTINPNGHPNIFDDISWTASYDVKRKAWISDHDWHPDLVMPSKRTFMTIKANGIWKHNERCDLFCNFYGVDYPFELEYFSNSTPTINVTRSLEYFLEVFTYGANCYDRYMQLYENFDEAVLWSNEQCSGLLKLTVQDISNPFGSLAYPAFNANSVDALYAKVENRYRIDMFYDLTDDRGQFNNARRLIWLTSGNGYVRELNPFNLNYQKAVTEQKRLRGLGVFVFLRRKVCGNNEFRLLFAINKNQPSPR